MLDGTISEQELQALLDHFQLGDDREALLRLVRQQVESEAPLSDREFAKYNRMTNRVKNRLRRDLDNRPRRLRRWLPYAAAAAILLAVGWLLLVDSRQSSIDGLAATNILPGGNRATLTLADGRVINLDEAQTGIVVGAEDITYDDGSVVSTVDRPHAGLTTYDLQLTTPKGGQYQITLPDGSKVWLNSASTLKYPSRFSEVSREVFLEGEAFFDITEIQGTRDTRVPFKVLTSGQTVEVLGTEFNVSAYQDEAETKTTLVEGKVNVTPGTQNGLTTKDSRLTTNILSPGQQATIRGAVIEINDVDVGQYTAWKSGRFSFAGKPFDQVMRELARWYDIDVRFEGGVPDKEFYGGAFRDHDLASVLLLLETADVDYRMDGRTLVISHKAGGNGTE